jgi:sugar-specific transcriptional regulator TrmB
LEYQATEVQTLIDLGLDSIQARIYISLARFGPSSVAAIAKKSKVNTLETHCTLINLYELGLIKKISETPEVFKAVSADQTLKFLLQRKAEPKFDAETLLSKLSIKKQPKSQANHFVLINEKQALIKRAIHEIYRTKKSADFIISWKLFSESVDSVYPESINPQVTIRCIIEQPPNLKDLNLKFSHPSNKIHYIQTTPKALLGIYDNKDVIMIEDPHQDLTCSPAMWTNNQGMLIMAQNYFENLWRKSNEKPLLKEKV